MPGMLFSTRWRWRGGVCQFKGANPNINKFIYLKLCPFDFLYPFLWNILKYGLLTDIEFEEIPYRYKNIAENLKIMHFLLFL